MNQRQEELFKHIIAEYTAQAKAIGSKFLVDKYHLEVSSATIRNDMAELEQAGLIEQPHTSAGRVPTLTGYKYYLEHYLERKPLEKKDQIAISQTWREFSGQGQETKIKQLGKQIALLADAAAIIGFSKDNFYYTGLSHLFHQPEFADFSQIYHISRAVDRLDEVIGDMFDQVKDTEINLGADCCFSRDCATILTKVNGKLFGILGPMRMDYGRNLGLIDYTRELLK